MQKRREKQKATETEAKRQLRIEAKRKADHRRYKTQLETETEAERKIGKEKNRLRRQFAREKQKKMETETEIRLAAQRRQNERRRTSEKTAGKTVRPVKQGKQGKASRSTTSDNPSQQGSSFEDVGTTELPVWGAKSSVKSPRTRKKQELDFFPRYADTILHRWREQPSENIQEIPQESESIQRPTGQASQQAPNFTMNAEEHRKRQRKQKNPRRG